MHAEPDVRLLQRYASDGTETAFDELVERHAGLVYSAALRQLNAPDQARDVTQSVFIDLARKAQPLAGKLPADSSLVGWLYRSTRFAVLNNLRSRLRERQAIQHLELMTPVSTPPLDWEPVRDLLDEAMSNLDDADRDALLLRFFKNEDFRTVGFALGISDDAAQKRVSRALEKLRELLLHRGISTTGAALSVAISTNALQNPPVELVAAISSAVHLAGTAVPASGALTATKTLAMTLMQKTLFTATLAVLAGTGIYEAYQNSRLRDQTQNLQQEQATLTALVAGLQSTNEHLADQLRGSRSPSLTSERLRELLRLRAEVGALRRRQRELEQTVAAAAQSQPPASQANSTAAPPHPGAPAPFEVQLVLDGPEADSESRTNEAGETLNVQKTPLLDHTAIRAVAVTKDASSGAPQIEVEFSPEGKDLFAAVTRENLNRRLAIVLNGQVLSAPVIRSEISEGKAQITGRFTAQEAAELAAKINDAIRNP